MARTGDQLLMAGGRDCATQQTLRCAALLDPRTSAWSEIADMTEGIPFVIDEPVLSNGLVAAIGESGRPAVYNPDLDTWWSGPALFPDHTVGDVAMAAIGDRLVVWSASPWKVLPGGKTGCCAPEPSAVTVQIPRDATEAAG